MLSAQPSKSLSGTVNLLAGRPYSLGQASGCAPLRCRRNCHRRCPNLRWLFGEGIVEVRPAITVGVRTKAVLVGPSGWALVVGNRQHTFHRHRCLHVATEVGKASPRSTIHRRRCQRIRTGPRWSARSNNAGIALESIRVVAVAILIKVSPLCSIDGESIGGIAVAITVSIGASQDISLGACASQHWAGVFVIEETIVVIIGVFVAVLAAISVSIVAVGGGEGQRAGWTDNLHR